MEHSKLRSVLAGNRTARRVWRQARRLRTRMTAAGVKLEPAVTAAPVKPAPPKTPAPRGPLKLHAAVLPRRRNRVVVVLADESLPTGTLRRYLAGLPTEPATILGGPDAFADWPNVGAWAASTSNDDDVEWFVRKGPVDIIIDLRRRKPESRRARWARLFLYLRPGGVWVVPRPTARGDLRLSERVWLAKLAGSAVADVTPKNGNPEAEALRAVAGLLSRPDLIVVEKRLRHVVKLRDNEIMTVLERRDPDVHVTEIDTLPAQVFHSTARVVSHESAVPIVGLETDIAVPQMSVRHYRGQVAVAGQSLMYAANSVLADSFRFYHALDRVSGGLLHHKMYHFGTRLARVHADKAPIESLPGTYYQLDPQFSAHFGHIMTETISRLWGWDAAKAAFPELKALLWVTVDPSAEPLPAGSKAVFQRALLRAFGIAEDDIVVVERPSYVHSLVSATAMWHNWPPYFVHPAIAETWRRIGDGVIDPGAPRYDRIFVSRAEDLKRRRCENSADVEALFAANGFTIVYPEEHTAGEQAAMFAGATTIAGFGGSAMFNVMYARAVRTIIILNHEGYTARNEHLFTAVLGCEVHYFWSTPDRVQHESSWSLGSYESAWSFDFARNERELTAVLESL